MKGNTDEHEDGRRNQTLDGQEKDGIGPGNIQGKATVAKADGEAMVELRVLKKLNSMLGIEDEK